MLKGKSTIQLFDCKTGKEVKRVVNTNMVTNAIPHLLNPPVSLMAEGHWLDSLNIYLPLQANGLAGLLIWDKNIPEDPNIIYPPADVNEVGHAGGAYSGANKYRGSYNVNESGAIDGGYRHVWDFASDRANGTINCLSLTSLEGGNSGLHNDGDSNIAIIYPFSAMISNTQRFLGRISDNCFVQLSAANTDGLQLIYNYINDMSAITISHKISTSVTKTVRKDVSLQTANRSINYTPDPDRPIVYLYNYTKKSDTEFDLWFAAVDYSTNTTLQERTITCTVPDADKYIISNCNGVFSDCFFACLYNKGSGYVNYHKYNIDGTYSGLLTNTNFYSGYNYFAAVMVGNKYYILDANGTTLYGFDVELIRGNSSYGITRRCYDYQQNDIAPYFLCSGYNDQHTAVRIYQSYLGTINNLAETVVKTPAQTMKITYEITEG